MGGTLQVRSGLPIPYLSTSRFELLYVGDDQLIARAIKVTNKSHVVSNPSQLSRSVLAISNPVCHPWREGNLLL